MMRRGQKGGMRRKVSRGNRSLNLRLRSREKVKLKRKKGNLGWSDRVSGERFGGV